MASELANLNSELHIRLNRADMDFEFDDNTHLVQGYPSSPLWSSRRSEGRLRDSGKHDEERNPIAG